MVSWQLVIESIKPLRSARMNDTTRWKDVPVDVWNYTLGGYQVLKKWLSYREKQVLGRALS